MMHLLTNWLMAGALAVGCVGSAQADPATSAPVQLAQTAGGGAGGGAAGTAAPGAAGRPGAGTAPAGAAGRPPVSNPPATVRNPPAAAGTPSAPVGDAAGTMPPAGATTPASPSAATPTPVPSAGATATDRSNPNSGTTTNPNGVTVTDPTLDDRANRNGRRTNPADPNDATVMDPADPNSRAQGNRLGPDSVTVTDPSNPEGVAGTLEGPAGTANRGTSRQRANEPATVNPPGATSGPNARRSRESVDADFAADLRSCEGLPPGELAACRGEAQRRRGNM